MHRLLLAVVKDKWCVLCLLTLFVKDNDVRWKMFVLLVFVSAIGEGNYKLEDCMSCNLTLTMRG